MNDIKMFCDANEMSSVLSHKPHQPTVFLDMFVHCNADNETEDQIDIYLSLQCEDTTIELLEYRKVHEKRFLNSAIVEYVLSILSF